MLRSVLLLGLLLRANTLPHVANKHNILFLMCDSMDGRVLDPTSPVSQRVSMPNLQALAASGTNFVRTYAESPQCVPSRASMFTGRYTHEIKAWSNEMGVPLIPSTGEPDPSCKQFYGAELCQKWGAEANVTATLLDSMRANGYEMNLYGKVDVGAGIIQDAKEGNSTCNGYHSGPSLGICTRSADIRRPTKPLPLEITNDEDNNVHPEDWKMVDKCVDFLHRQDSTGWMLYCSVNIPHPAFNTNATWLSYVNESAIPAPIWAEKNEMHPADSYMSQSKNVWGDYTPEQVHKVRKTYYAMCAETDFLMGRVLQALKASGQYDDTYIMFLSDHGEMNMEHRQVWKNSLYEPSARVPMMVAGPGIKAGAVVTELTSLLDVFPTLVELAGGTPPGFLRGVSLVPMMAPGRSQAGGDRFVTAQYHSNMGNTGSFMVRWREWKYITFGTNLDAFQSYKPQLFDVEEDPDELNDIATQHQDVLEVMDEKLRSLYDYQAVDKACKANDFAIYKQFFAQKMNEKTLFNKLQKAYTGFNQSDQQKLLSWAQQAAKL